MTSGGSRRLRTRLVVALTLACSACGASGTHDKAADASVDTSATGLVPEAGFAEVPALPDGGYAARMFYVFQPADEDAPHKPLLVLFNGSAHLAMEVGLLAYGTSRTTLDPNAPETAPAKNSARWTRFANLLYLNSRDSGFSYYLGATAAGAGDPDASPPALEMTQPQDAADCVRALLDFLDRHLPLRASPVVLVGESEGALRATWMLDLLLRYSTEAPQVEGDLRARIQAHYDLVFPGSVGSTVDEGTAATQFGAQILIQPEVVGCQCPIGFVDTRCVAAIDGGSDEYNLAKPIGWTGQLQSGALAAWSARDEAAALAGVDLGSIALLLPDARKDAFHAQATGANSTKAPINQALSARLGALPQPWDRYFDMDHLEQDAEQPGLGNTPTGSLDYTYASKFVENLRRVRTFITDAYCDPRIYSPGIPTALAQQGLDIVMDTTPRKGVARPGWFRAGFPSERDAAPSNPAQTIEVRFPPYATSGHMVAVTQPAELAADVQSWLEGE